MSLCHNNANSERTGATLALSDSDGADFRYGQLFISSVTVDGLNYKASFSVINKDDLVLFFDVELVLIPDTKPPQFRAITAESVVE